MRFNILLQLVERGYDVDLVVTKRVGVLIEKLPAEVSVFPVAERVSAWFAIGLFNYMRLRKPTHILTSHEDISPIVLLVNRLLGRPARVLASTHNSLTRLAASGGALYRFKYAIILPLLGKLYPGADSLVAVSKGVAQEMSSVLGISQDKIEVIYNPVITPRFEEMSRAVLPPIPAELRDRHVVGFFGRLHAQKRVPTLLRALAVLEKPEACALLLAGTGELEADLRREADSLGVAESVCFYGYAENPYPLMKMCDVIVLPSEFEGLGNVLIEALACGVQVVSTDCPHGPAEILERGKWGQLVPVGDHEALARAIEASLDGRFHVEAELLRQRSRDFSSEVATTRYLKALGLPARARDGERQ
jgi:glycosyltransferase involved in cell wall biosynthesis